MSSITPVGPKAPVQAKVLSERSERALALQNEAHASKRKMKVLEEEEFVEKLEKIIERDFFPYLETVRKQSEYLDALDSQNSIRIAEAEKQLGKTPHVEVGDTPSKEGWDDEDWIKNTPGPSKVPSRTSEKEAKLKKELEGVSLSQFMARYTSEDNDSFTQIMKTNEQKRREKLDWIYKHEQDEEKSAKSDSALMPPPATPFAVTDGRSSKPLDTWKYKAHNTVMYYPEGASLTDQEIQDLKDSHVKVQHSATRLGTRPWGTSINMNMATTAAASSASQQTKGDGFWNGVVEKVGINGKQSWEIASSPKVNGFSFVATPSPRPGVGDSPLMTWGEVDSTPYLIDSAGDTSKFRMKAPSEREKLAHSLAERAAAAKKKQKAMKTVQDNFTHGTVPQSPRFTGLSPAAKRLAVGKLGISRGVDKKLMASYSPSPSQSSKERFATPVSVVAPFPSPSPRLFATKTPDSGSSDAPKIRKAKASDFF